jgi:hypothetical protein
VGLAKRWMVLEFQGERWGECVANSARSKSSEAALLGFLIGRFADWPIMIHSPLQRSHFSDCRL